MANVEFIDKKRIKVVAQNGDEYVIGFDSTMNYQINERYDNYVLEFLEHLFDKYYDGESETVWEFSLLFMTRKFDPFFYILSGKDVERTKIGMRIKQIRKEKKIEAKVLAEKAGIDPANLSKIEQGKYSAGFDVLSKIAKVLNCKVDLVEI